MKKNIVYFLILILAGRLSAQQRIATYYEQTTPEWTVRIYEGDPMNVREYRLRNGLTVITSTNKQQPRINTMIAVKTGSKNDPSDHTGLAHYLEHMLFKGTDRYGSLDWNKEKPFLDQIDELYELYNHTTDTNARKMVYHKIDSVSQLAAKWAIANEYDKMTQAIGAEGTNAFTSVEQTVYINDIPSNMLEKWLKLEGERYRNPILRLFHTELEAVYEEKNISLDNDNSKVWEKLYAELFQKHNYGQQTTIGTIEHLKNPSLKAIREYYHKYYVPNNMAVILSGDFNPDSAAMSVVRNFEWMQIKDVPPYESPAEMIHASPQKFTITGPDAENVTIGYRLPGANTRESRIAKLIDLLLNNSSAGLIDLNLVKQQKVLSAFSTVDVMNDYSVFVLGGKPREGQTLDSVKNLLVAQMQLIIDGKFDEELLKAVILNTDIDRIREYKENNARCNFLLEAFVQGVNYQKAFNELWEMTKVTKEEIMDLAKEFLNQDRVEVYKIKGVDNVTKIQKPEISSVELNRDKQSDFVKNWLATSNDEIKPVFADFSRISRKKLGATELFYIKNNDNRLFTLVYRFDYGRFHDKKLPMAMDYLKYLGNGKMSSEEISKKMYNLGCRYYAGSGDRRSYITLTGPAENLEEALAILEELFQNPVADEKAFTDMLDGERKKRTDAKLNNRAIANRLAQYALFGADNPTKWVLSSAELASLKSSDLVNIIKGLGSYSHSSEYYGTLGMAEIESVLNKYHPAAKNGAKAKASPAIKEFSERENKENEVFFTHYEQVQASIYWLNKGSVYQASEETVIECFNQYFGGDMSSVVFQNIREAKALAYSTYAAYSTPSLAGKPNVTYAFIGTQADKFHEAIAAMNDLLNTLPTDEGVFLLSKESMKNKIETQRYDDESLIEYYFQLADLGLTEDYRSTVYSTLPSIAMDDVKNFHKSRISNKKHAFAIVANKEKIKNKDLEKYGKVTMLTLEDIFGY